MNARTRRSWAIRYVLLAIALSPISHHRGFADDIFVDDNAPNDPAPGDPTISDPLEDGSLLHPYDALQEAVDAASPNDVVVVLDGVYRGVGNRDVSICMPITVQSLNGPEACTIDCEVTGRAFAIAPTTLSSIAIVGFTITNGDAPGGGVDYGGAIFVETASDVIVERCRFLNNFRAIGGAIATAGGTLSIRDTVFLSNSAVLAGAVYVQGTTLAVDRCQFIDNSAGAWGALAVDVDATGQVDNCLFQGNAGNTVGGAIACLNTLTIVNSTFVQNTANQTGGAITIDGVFGEAEAHVSNCILWDNAAPVASQIWVDEDSLLTIEYSDTMNGIAGIESDPSATIEYLDGNINSDPMFANAIGGDFRLSITSPCVDSGSSHLVNSISFIDLDKFPRLVDVPEVSNSGAGCPMVDMGAYENQSGNACCPGDISSAETGVPDGQVNVSDLLLLLAQWGSSCPCDADITGPGDQRDGVVDVVDLLSLLANWGMCD